VIAPRQGLLGANTPWQRVRACPGLDPGFTRGRGTSATSRAMKSSGVCSHFCKLLGNLLTLILLSFHLEVILPICFMQLTGILISTFKPPMQSFL